MQGMRKIPLIIIAAFLLLWLVGITNGEVGYVLERAVSICLECVGIG